MTDKEEADLSMLEKARRKLDAKEPDRYQDAVAELFVKLDWPVTRYDTAIRLCENLCLDWATLNAIAKKLALEGFGAEVGRDGGDSYGDPPRYYLLVTVSKRGRS